MDDGSVEKLTDLPTGTYESIAYHPSGLALGFIVDQGQRQGIWLSSNEGKDPVRLVFSRPDTTFSSVAFSPDGTQIWWIAQHAGALSEIHWMDLADRSTFQTVLSRGLSPTAHGLQLAPSGPLMSATQGASCGEEQAMVVDAQGAHQASRREAAVSRSRCRRWSGATAPARRPRSSMVWTSARHERSCATRRRRFRRRRTKRRRRRPAASGDSPM